MISTNMCPNFGGFRPGSPQGRVVLVRPTSVAEVVGWVTSQRGAGTVQVRHLSIAHFSPQALLVACC